MPTRALLGVLAAALTGLVALAVTTPWSGREGRVLVALGGEHGVHASDLPAVALWLVGIVACVGLLRRS